MVEEAFISGHEAASADTLLLLNSDVLPKYPGWLSAMKRLHGELESPGAVAALRPLLPDLLVGPAVMQALGRIGGSDAAAALTAHWLSFNEMLDRRSVLGLLSHALSNTRSDERSEDEALPSEEASER